MSDETQKASTNVSLGVPLERTQWSEPGQRVLNSSPGLMDSGTHCRWLLSPGQDLLKVLAAGWWSIHAALLFRMLL
jgi:hypothetical protein